MIKYRVICAVYGLTRLFYMNTVKTFFYAAIVSCQPGAVNHQGHQLNPLNNKQQTKRGNYG